MIRITAAMGQIFSLSPYENSPERMPWQPSDWGIFLFQQIPKSTLAAKQLDFHSHGVEWCYLVSDGERVSQ